MALDIKNDLTTIKPIVVEMGSRKRPFELSPLRLMGTLLLSVFIVETVVMVVLESKEKLGWRETLIDSSLLTVTLFVILFYTLFKPLVLLIDDYRDKESQLKQNQELLEREIQERTRSEAALHETKAILQAAMDQSPAGIAIADAPDGVLRYVNEAGLFIRGGSRDVLVENVGFDRYVERWQLLDLDGVPLSDDMVPLTRAIRTGEPVSMEIIIRRSSDDDRFVIVNAAPIKNDSGEVVAGVAVFLDITDRKKTEEELKVYRNHLELLVLERSHDLEETTQSLRRENEQHVKAQAALQESEERFRQIFEKSEDAIVLISPRDHTIIDVNPTAERIFRRHHEDLVNRGLARLFDEAGFTYLRTTLEQITAEQLPGRIERLECCTEPDSVRILSFRGKLITLQGDNVIYSTFRDITSRIRLEEQALEIQARLIQANRMTSLGTMVSSVAHEINNPNNFLMMNAGIIKQAWADIAPVVEQYYRDNGDFPVARSTWNSARIFLPDAIEGIQQGAQRISDIVGNLKAFGRDDRFTADAVADVNAVVQLSAAILSHHISTATSRFSCELGENIPLARGSARQLEQVIINLIQNALLALPDRFCGVHVSTLYDSDHDQVLIRVSDEGTGIPPEIAARIMEPFFTTRLDKGGTGLGLAISSTIVKEHGGSIEFASEPGRGTVFTVRLSRADHKASHVSPGEDMHVQG